MNLAGIQSEVLQLLDERTEGLTDQEKATLTDVLIEDLCFRMSELDETFEQRNEDQGSAAVERTQRIDESRERDRRITEERVESARAVEHPDGAGGSDFEQP